MLDTQTKRRIDTARDILVGKVPDPKSQVEQITIALIYKFMDDMDAEAEELGGKRKFFNGDFARYGWAKLMRGGLGGHEMLNLYADGITKMPENPGIPPLFRDIFKNAYLPYRDPETLKSFLKIIDEFTYDHSERLGDAFEYLLSVLGSQGDAGQFRTPRHIIDFIVEIIDPKKGESILDPACGTAGFIISAYKYILRNNTDAQSNSTLTPDEKGRLAKNFKGYDISPDMVRLSLVNLYLHGFNDPHIYEYDTLTSEERWNEFADVILANPPFMSPKGGIKPHKRFSIQAKRSEVLFVDYMAEHITATGRAGIIVPEGIIFQSQTAYKDLRKMLVENSLVAVISLPSGCFNPYSGVKTSILILDKSIARQSSSIAFFKVENDGFGLGAQRKAIEKNDLPQVKTELETYLQALRSQQPTDDLQITRGLIVQKEKIAANGDYNLSGERYREGLISNSAYPLVPVGQFIKKDVKTVDPRNSPNEIFELWSIPAFDAGTPEMLRGSEIGSQKKVVVPGDVLLSRIIPHIRRGWVVVENLAGWRQIASTEWIVFSSNEIIPAFLRQILVSDFFNISFMQTITGVGGSLARANPGAVGEIKIPLPPLEIQKEIVAEIEGYQKVIDGARAVMDNYRPHIPIDPEWPMVDLGDICRDILSGGTPSTTVESYWNGTIPWMSSADIVDAKTIYIRKYITQEGLKNSATNLIPRGNIIVVTRVGLGKVVVNEFDVCISQDSQGLILDRERIVPEFLLYILTKKVQIFKDTSQGTTIQGVTKNTLRTIQVPLPPIATQQAIVAEIEAEQALVNGNRELITRFEKKIQTTLAMVWGEKE
ncbi:MAG: N-6 DNA methylase [Desulfamplus sp.]|nr:N-6 DNA methylase [Desulfamplus sp.]